jgi:hypothetical protein
MRHRKRRFGSPSLAVLHRVPSTAETGRALPVAARMSREALIQQSSLREPCASAAPKCHPSRTKDNDNRNIMTVAAERTIYDVKSPQSARDALPQEGTHGEDTTATATNTKQPRHAQLLASVAACAPGIFQLTAPKGRYAIASPGGCGRH